MEILCLPTVTPKLSAAEPVWKGAKYGLATSEHHETLEDLTHAVSEYLRMCPVRLNIYRFLYRGVWGEIFNERHWDFLAATESDGLAACSGRDPAIMGF